MTPLQAKSLGVYLHSARKDKGLSTSVLAERTGLTRTIVLRIEHGDVEKPSPHKLAALANALSLPLSDIYSRAGYTGLSEVQLNAAPYVRARPDQEPDEAAQMIDTYFPKLIDEYGWNPDGPALGADEI